MKWKGKETKIEKSTTCSEEESMILSEIELEIRNYETKSAQITKNVTLMDEALRHVKMK